MTEIKSGRKAGRVYVDKTTPDNLGVKMKMCPLSGIPCSECGYEAVVSGYPDCFLSDLVRAIMGVGKEE